MFLLMVNQEETVEWNRDVLQVQVPSKVKKFIISLIKLLCPPLIVNSMINDMI